VLGYGRSLLFRLARKSAHYAAVRFLITLIFSRLHFLLPVQRLHETDTLLAFYHPHPSYPLHILLTPKRPLIGLPDLTAADADFMTDLFQTVQRLVVQFNLEQSGYRLIVNGGAYQDIPHLHFHLIVD
jgi:histidine triad (HIT) family protein